MLEEGCSSVLLCPACGLWQVAKLVQKKGRISLADFTRESNRLINLSLVVDPPAPTSQAAEEAKTG